MTIYEILAQVFGFFALIFIVLGYQTESRKRFLFLSMMADVFFGINFALLGAASGVATSVISVIKAFVFYCYEKKKKRAPIFVLVLIEMTIITAGLFTCDSLISVIPIFVSVIYTIGQWQTNLKVSYFMGMIVSILLTIYHMLIGAYSAALSSTLELVSSSTGFMKLNIKEKRYNKKNI